ncbi:DUF2267 domain-containing protein [Micromonospora sp. NPDC000089]|uniref:DUF2267 domain-containing protein n=1 Tax=unclassified Micromonospora TaxID=2617518 RepID=UPI0036C27501
MADEPISVFESSRDKTNQILKDIERAYGWPRERRNQSYAALRTVLHLLRDRMPVQESVEFAQQLPVLVRGVYFDGWQPANVPIKLDRDDFRYEVRQGFPYDAEGGPERVAQVVLDTLRRHVSQGEWEDVRSTMPADLARMIP